MAGASDIEKSNLEAHVELCAHRYSALEKRMTSVEEKISTLQSVIEKSHMSTIKVLIGTAGTVIVGVLSLLGVLIAK